MRPLKEESAKGLQSLLDNINHHREALRSLKRPVDMWDDWFIHLVGQSLDPTTRRYWELEKGDTKTFPNYDILTSFLKRRVRTLSATEGISLDKKYQMKSQKKVKVMATYTLRDCTICKGPHHASRCYQLISLKSDRRKFIEKFNLCYNFLGNNHQVRQCPSNSSCRTCKGRHHTILHSNKRRAPEPKNELTIKQANIDNQADDKENDEDLS